MGNRSSLGEGPGFARLTTRTPNGLNQYSSVNRPGTLDVTDRGRYREAARHFTVPETSILRHGLARLELSMSERLQITPDICHGKPVIRGTRVLVSTILGALAGGDPIESVLEDYPNITREDVRAALEFASRLSDYEESAYDAVA